MKTLDIGSKWAFQGDVGFVRDSKIPAEAVRQKDSIVGHSETGHTHVAEGAEVFAMPDGMTLYMRAIGESIDIVHNRAHDTHERIKLLTKPGDTFRVRRQREWTPAGWVRVQD